MSSKTLEVLEELKRISLIKVTTHILYGSDDVLSLYRKSLNMLLKSDCLDFNVIIFETQLGREPEIIIDIFVIEGYLLD